MKNRFSSAKEVSYKGPFDLVTDVDLLAEHYIKDTLEREFPNIGYLGEELGSRVGSTGMRWIVDPVDGTRNFAANVPHFAISLALVNCNEILLGATYDPMRDELFHAVKEEGAFLNGKPIYVTRRSAISESILGFDVGGMDIRALSAFKMIKSLWPGMQSVRIMGSATLGLAYAAAGRLDVYFHHTLSPWDVATGLLLVREAGGEVMDRCGGLATIMSSGLVASNTVVLKEFLDLTKDQDWYTVD
ncbi:inositol monophosphatase [Dehalococcoidia bacterium]|nr:inositol monophosphatase [Dehalococcoidia bacterium]